LAELTVAPLGQSNSSLHAEFQTVGLRAQAIEQNDEDKTTMDVNTTTDNATVTDLVRGRFVLKEKRRSFLLDIEHPSQREQHTNKILSGSATIRLSESAAIMSLFWLE
jgi:hypothetical protein